MPPHHTTQRPRGTRFPQLPSVGPGPTDHPYGGPLSLSIIKKPPKSDGDKRKSAATKDRDKKKIPRCRICQGKNKEEYHWHEDCPHFSTSVYAKRTAATSATTSKKKNTVTFEEVEEDD